MKQKRLENDLWEFKFNGFTITDTYSECIKNLELAINLLVVK